jgi:hypothetical protein
VQAPEKLASTCNETNMMLNIYIDIDERMNAALIRTYGYLKLLLNIAHLYEL